MEIKIAERFRPFVHIPGVHCVLPFTTLCFHIYPAFIRVIDLSTSTHSVVAEFPLSIQGPVEGFTVQQDLEKGFIKVWGDSAQGFFRYRIEFRSLKEFVLISEKMPEVLPQEYCGVSTGQGFESVAIERLSFGITKKADWALVDRRIILAEILPFWFRLGQMTPAVISHKSGSASLLDPIHVALNQKNSLELASAIKSLFQVGFEGLMCPTLIDKMHQGFLLPIDSIQSSDSPLVLLTKGAQLIKEMLVSVNDKVEDGVSVDILPCLLPELHAGRYCDVQLGSIGKLDLEWTKKQTRRIIFHSAKEQTLTFNFQKDLRSFRLRDAISSVATIKTCGKCHVFAAGTYYLDNFER